MNMTHDKTSVISYLEDHGIGYNNPKKITDIFNNHFSSVGRWYATAIKTSKKNIKNYLSVLTTNSKNLFWTPTTTTEVLKIFAKLPNKKSSGYDIIDNIILKELKTQICTLLSLLINQSLNKGRFPKAIKMAEVVPLYKGKEKCLCNNYRPISLLITLSKILEKVVYQRTFTFLNETGQLFESQYRFRLKHSCEHAVQELLSNRLKELEQGKKTLSVFFDLSKADMSLSTNVRVYSNDIPKLWHDCGIAMQLITPLCSRLYVYCRSGEVALLLC